MKLNIQDAVITKNTGIEKYGFLPLTKEQYEIFDSINNQYYSREVSLEDFTTVFGAKPTAFILHGKTDEDVKSEDVERYIDNCTVRESEIRPFRKSYKCFCGDNFGLDYTTQVLHGTALDSWNCLLTFCGNPEYGMVINLKEV